MIADDERAAVVTGTRRERVREMMRDDILAAARQILKTDGVKGLAMRALGRAVGVTAPTLYDYFSSKQAVLDALYVEGAQRLHAELTAAVAQTEPGIVRLQEVGRAYRRFALQNPDLYLLIFGRVDATYRPGKEEKRCGHDNYTLVVEVVAEAIERGDLRPGDPIVIAHAVWFMAHGFVTLEIGGFMDEPQTSDTDQENAIPAEELYAQALGYLAMGFQGQPPR